MKYIVIIAERAERDASEIREWIAERSPDGAARWQDSFDQALKSLKHNPESCSLAPENEFISQEIRHIIFKTSKGRRYRAIFAIEGNEVHVAHVRGPGQSFLTLEELEN